VAKLSPEDYEVLDSFVLKSLNRLAAGEDDVSEVYADFMHVLTA
jgi:hypothetical protein